ncbi:MAG: hypothetical protein KIT09_30430 [Bryobacteraceae bacterium]|nr:hypothetical protein [Bryobacteraceae bacterium]
MKHSTKQHMVVVKAKDGYDEHFANEEAAWQYMDLHRLPREAYKGWRLVETSPACPAGLEAVQ